MGAVIGPTLFLNRVDVVPTGVVSVYLLLVNEMLKFVVVGVSPILFSFLWNACCHGA